MRSSQTLISVARPVIRTTGAVAGALAALVLAVAAAGSAAHAQSDVASALRAGNDAISRRDCSAARDIAAKVAEQFLAVPAGQADKLPWATDYIRFAERYDAQCQRGAVVAPPPVAARNEPPPPVTSAAEAKSALQAMQAALVRPDCGRAEAVSRTLMNYSAAASYDSIDEFFYADFKNAREKYKTRCIEEPENRLNARQLVTRAKVLYQEGKFRDASSAFLDASLLLQAGDPLKSEASRGRLLAQCMDLVADRIDVSGTPECLQLPDVKAALGVGNR